MKRLILLHCCLVFLLSIPNSWAKGLPTVSATTHQDSGSPISLQNTKKPKPVKKPSQIRRALPTWISSHDTLPDLSDWIINPRPNLDLTDILLRGEDDDDGTDTVVQTRPSPPSDFEIPRIPLPDPRIIPWDDPTPPWIAYQVLFNAGGHLDSTVDSSRNRVFVAFEKGGDPALGMPVSEIFGRLYDSRGRKIGGDIRISAAQTPAPLDTAFFRDAFPDLSQPHCTSYHDPSAVYSAAEDAYYIAWTALCEAVIRRPTDAGLNTWIEEEEAFDTQALTRKECGQEAGADPECTLQQAKVTFTSVQAVKLTARDLRVSRGEFLSDIWMMGRLFAWFLPNTQEAYDDTTLWKWSSTWNPNLAIDAQGRVLLAHQSNIKTSGCANYGDEEAGADYNELDGLSSIEAQLIGPDFLRRAASLVRFPTTPEDADDEHRQEGETDSNFCEALRQEASIISFYNPSAAAQGDSGFQVVFTSEKGSATELNNHEGQNRAVSRKFIPVVDDRAVINDSASFVPFVTLPHQGPIRVDGMNPDASPLDFEGLHSQPQIVFDGSLDLYTVSFDDPEGSYAGFLPAEGSRTPTPIKTGFFDDGTDKNYAPIEDLEGGRAARLTLLPADLSAGVRGSSRIALAFPFTQDGHPAIGQNFLNLTPSPQGIEASLLYAKNRPQSLLQDLALQTRVNPTPAVFVSNAISERFFTVFAGSPPLDDDSLFTAFVSEEAIQPADVDADGIPDATDNCPQMPNPDQADEDQDGVGDACDSPDCGNNRPDENEECDDGNRVNGDGCQNNCLLGCNTATYVPLETSCGEGACSATVRTSCDDGIERVPLCTPGNATDEICGDGIDNDCDGDIDNVDGDGDGFLSAACGGEDCDDVQRDTHPGAAEVCDGVDNNCLGGADEGFDDDGDGVPNCRDLCPNDRGQTEPGACGCGIAATDTDADAIADCLDNCPNQPNQDQADANGDGIGDECQANPDPDGDGLDGNRDNCPVRPNPGQEDRNNNGIGDVCDDPDADGRFDVNDNCPDTPNQDQADGDGDRIGDACDRPECGNGLREGEEICDDHNREDGDGCQADCTPGCHTALYQPRIISCGEGACETEVETSCNRGREVIPACMPRNPAPEACDGTDNDCNGQIDDVPDVGRACQAGDGICQVRGQLVCQGNELRCSAQAGNPQAETCNNLDDDCDGTTDNNLDDPRLGVACSEGLGACRDEGVTTCEAGAVACNAQPGLPAAQEACNEIDDNCNGRIDEGFDADNDGTADCRDNCPARANANQSDRDRDTLGDLCDNCPDTANQNQNDADNDGIGDACDAPAPVIGSFTPSEALINENFERAELVWAQVANADSIRITLSQGQAQWYDAGGGLNDFPFDLNQAGRLANGTLRIQPLAPGNMRFTLTAVGGGGQQTAQDSIRVNDVPSSAPVLVKPTQGLRLSPSRVYVSWEAAGNNADDDMNNALDANGIRSYAVCYSVYRTNENGDVLTPDNKDNDRLNLPGRTACQDPSRQRLMQVPADWATVAPQVAQSCQQNGANAGEPCFVAGATKHYFTVIDLDPTLNDPDNPETGEYLRYEFQVLALDDNPDLIGVAVSQTSAILTDSGTVARWQLDEGAGETITDSIHDLTATFSGTPSWVGGINGQGLSFSGSESGDVVNAQQSGLFDALGSGDFTFSTWYFSAEDNRAQAILEKRDQNRGFELYKLRSGHITLYASGCDPHITSPSASPLNQWRHVSVSRTDDRISLYENGELTAQSACNQDFSNNTSPLSIGCNGPVIRCQEEFNGTLDEIEIRDAALSEAAVRNEFCSAFLSDTQESIPAACR